MSGGPDRVSSTAVRNRRDDYSVNLSMRMIGVIGYVRLRPVAGVRGLNANRRKGSQRGFPQRLCAPQQDA
jgi:hypothetical protein